MQTYTLRVLNEYDQSYDFENIGLASKQVIYDIVKTSLSNDTRTNFNKLTKEEQNNLVKESIIPYLKSHEKKLQRKYERTIKSIRESIHKFVEEKDDIAYINLLYYVTSLNKHLNFGSTMVTDWISTTANFDSIFKYYDKQKVHKVVCVNTITNGVYNEDTLVVDVSNKEAIDKIKGLGKNVKEKEFRKFIEIFKNENPRIIKKLYEQFLFERTSIKSRGYSYSTSDNEVCFFRYIKKENIISVFEQLHIDLICADLFNSNFLTLSKEEQKLHLNKLKWQIQQVLLNNPKVKKEYNDIDYLLYVFKKLYEKNLNVDFITNSKYEKEKMLDARTKILSYSYNAGIYNPMLK